MYFTIMDFKKATELFADPDFDGDPVQIYQPGEGESPVPPEEESEETGGNEGDGPEGEETLTDPPPPGGNGGGIISDPPPRRKKYVIAGVTVSVVAERVQYYGPDGKLITESLKDYTRKTVLKDYKSLDDFLQAWTSAERKEAVVKELEEHGVLFEALADEVGKDFDSFDLVCHVAFDRPPLTRRERAEEVRKQDYFSKYEEKARAVLEALLEKYANEGLNGRRRTPDPLGPCRQLERGQPAALLGNRIPLRQRNLNHTKDTMTINELIERLEEYRDGLGGDTEVRLMTQQNWPFENEITGLVSGDEINERLDAQDEDVDQDAVVFIVEGTQRCYGSRRAWEVAY